jgi:hypothetical protein
MRCFAGLVEDHGETAGGFWFVDVVVLQCCSRYLSMVEGCGSRRVNAPERKLLALNTSTEYKIGEHGCNAGPMVVI